MKGKVEGRGGDKRAGPSPMGGVGWNTPSRPLKKCENGGKWEKGSENVKEKKK